MLCLVLQMKRNLNNGDMNKNKRCGGISFLKHLMENETGK